MSIQRSWDGALVGEYPGAMVEMAVRERTVEIVFTGPRMGTPEPVAPKGRLWRLWEYEVLECFIVGAEDQYVEIEVGPHGHYLALRLDGVRKIVDKNVPVAADWSAGPVARDSRGDPTYWSARVVIARHELPPPPWRVNSFAIFDRPAPLAGQERAATSCSERVYMAATRVPGDVPDFHRLECFTVALTPE